MNLFFMKIPWKCLEKPMNAFLMAMKTEILGFMAFIYTMKFPWNLEGWFSWAMKSLQKHWKWFSRAIKFLSISDWQNSWPMKIQCQPNMYFMGHENSNWPWNSHESISGSFLQYPLVKKKSWKCQTHSRVNLQGQRLNITFKLRIALVRSAWKYHYSTCNQSHFRCVCFHSIRQYMKTVSSEWEL